MSFCSGVGLASLQGAFCIQGSACRGFCIQGRTRKAGGVHPTGMLSSYLRKFFPTELFLFYGEPSYVWNFLVYLFVSQTTIVKRSDKWLKSSITVWISCSWVLGFPKKKFRTFCLLPQNDKVWELIPNSNPIVSMQDFKFQPQVISPPELSTDFLAIFRRR